MCRWFYIYCEVRMLYCAYAEGSGMYLETFLLDNFLMDLLLLRLAAAIASRHLPVRRLMLGAFAGALLSWAALFLPALFRFPGKLITGLILTLFFPFCSKKAFLHTAVSVFAAAFLVGGLAFAAAYSFGEREGGLVILPSPVRGMLTAAAAAVLLPAAVRRFRTARRQNGFRRELIFFAGGKEYRLSALIDTGNALAEPLSGRSVVIAYLPELAPYASIPVPAKSVLGQDILFALLPAYIRIDGEEADALIAITKAPLAGTDALLPAALAEPSNEKGEEYATHYQSDPCGIISGARAWRRRLLRQFRRGAAAAPFKGRGKRLPSPSRCRGGSGEGDAY
ncbi:MAG: hypothetical protein E7330_04340 [Clostridiales bacterium]|nr:hypothetical protein [Clostridiales bacterium]